MSLREFYKRILFRLHGRVIYVTPKGPIKGRVLFSYVTLPFFRPGPWDSHTNYWEGRNMVEAFLERGYAVDVIDSTNHSFIPKKKYDFFIDNSTNMQRLTTLLPNTKKIFHITNAEPRFQNVAERTRAENLKKRRGIVLAPDRIIAEVPTVELAEYATALGNKFTIDTYSYANKHIDRIPLSSTHLFPFPEDKKFDGVRKNFIWIGGSGPLHKGLDLILEAFAALPEYHLTICGKIKEGDPFAKAFAKELYHTANITTVGFIDLGSEQFRKISTESLAIISVSCAEGGGGSTITGMHAGLIPIVNFESSVDVGDFGVMLPDSYIETIRQAVRDISALPAEQLQSRAKTAWEYAREHHTRERFAKEYRLFLDKILQSNA